MCLLYIQYITFDIIIYYENNAGMLKITKLRLLFTSDAGLPDSSDEK